MKKVAICLFFAVAAFGQKKPITLETLQGGRGGGRGRAGAGPSIWAPDGKTFLVRQGRNINVYDPATQTSKLVIDTTEIDAAAVGPPAEEGPTDWTNRRARVAGMQFAPDGKLLLYGAGGDL